MKVLYLARKEFIEIFRQRELLPLIFIAPLVMIIVLGYVVKTDVENVPIEMMNLDNGKISQDITQRLVYSPLFKVKKISFQYHDGREELKKGRVKAVVIFRPQIGKKGIWRTYPDVQILMDGLDANTSSLATGYVNGLIKQYVLDDMKRQGISLPLESKPLFRYNLELKSINYMGPGIVALLLTILSLFLTSISIVREKEQGTFDNLLISRLSVLEIFIGKALPMAILGLGQMCLGVAVVVLWFQIPIRGNIFYLFPGAVVFLVAILSYALLISTIARTQQQALFYSWFSMTLFILLSGLFTSVDNIPPALRFLVYMNPLRYLIRIVRQIFLKGNSILFFLPDLLGLLFIATIAFAVSLLIFKQTIRQ